MEIKALTPYFEDYAIYYSTDRDILIIARKKGSLTSPSAEIFSVPGLKDELARIYLNSAKDLELRRLSDKSAIHPLFASFDIPANSDYHPVLDLKAVKQRFLNNSASDLIALAYSKIPTLKLLDQHRLADNFTNITQYHTPAITMFTMIGTSIRDAYLNTAQQTSFFPPKYRKNLQEMNQYFFQCGPADTIQKIDVLLTFANAVIPFLSKHELDDIWQVIMRSACYTQLSGIDKDWIELLHSLSVGNAEKISLISRHLLSSAAPRSAGQGEFLIGSALLGSLLKNKPQEASLVWRQYHAQYQLDTDSNLLLRLMAAHNGLI